MLIRVRRMTVIMRILHWVLALSIVACFVTGLYIATPMVLRPVGYGPSDTLVMGSVRLVHFVFAMLVDVAFLVWFYLFFFSLEHPFVQSILPFGRRLGEAGQMLRHYFTLKHKPPTQDPDVDPLNAYGFLLIHFLVFVQMITGFALMRPTFSHANSLVPLWPWILRVSEQLSVAVFGTIVTVRQVHHLAAFVIVALAMVHIYLQVWRDIFWTEGHISVVVSGYKYIEEER
ncbi:MAG: Ni/Fe-hydrogenase, b-type cytochrome subunit [Deferrisomatales bacterium]